MRVCYLLQKAKQTGARSVGQRLGYGLADRGHDVTFIVPKPTGYDNDEPFVRDGHAFIPNVDLGSAVNIASPDVLVAHESNQELVEAMPLINSMTTTVFRYGVNLVESHLNGNEGHVEHYPAFIRSFDAILAPSDHAVNKLVGLGIDRERVHVVYPPMREEQDAPDFTDRPNEVGVVARHSRIKNLPFLARAIRYYEDEYGDAPTVKVAAGVSKYQETLLTRHARSLSIDHKFDLLGWVNPYEAVYSQVRAVALCSLSEHFPAVFSEAFSHGLPVLAPDAGWAIPPAVYASDDPASFAEELHDILAEPGVIHAAQMANAPDGIRKDRAVGALEAALEATVERCAPFTLKGGVA